MSLLPNSVEAFRLIHITTVPITLNFLTGHIEYMKKQGVETEAVSSPEQAFERFFESTGIICHPISIERRMAPAKDVVSLYRLYRLLKDRRPDVVHSHTPKAGLLGTLAARMAGVPCRVLSIFGLPQMTKAGIMKTLLDVTTRLACTCADLVWCDSPSMRNYVIQHKLCPAGKAVVLGQGSVGGVDAESKFNPDNYGKEARQNMRARYGIPGDARIIGFVGRIVSDKGMNEFAQAWSVLRNEFPDVHVLLIGMFESADPILPENEQVFRSDPRVHLSGWCSDIPEHLAIIDLLVNPSYREGFGVVHLEAAAMRIPVLATDIPGCIDSVQHGASGTLIPPRNVQALQTALRRYLNEPSLRQRHGEAGRKRALESFRPEQLSEALLEKYRELLATRKRS